jgi:hypothetical protein
MEGKKLGRPTLYRPEYCEQLIKHMESGLTYDTFGGTIPDNGVCVDTTNEWVKHHPEFAAAKKRGKILANLYWDKIALLVARGKKVTDKKTGEIIVDPKNIIPSIFIFTLKNRVGWRDIPITVSEDTDKNKLVINRKDYSKEKKEESKKSETT